MKKLYKLTESINVIKVKSELNEKRLNDFSNNIKTISSTINLIKDKFNSSFDDHSITIESLPNIEKQVVVIEKTLKTLFNSSESISKNQNLLKKRIIEKHKVELEKLIKDKANVGDLGDKLKKLLNLLDSNLKQSEKIQQDIFTYKKNIDDINLNLSIIKLPKIIKKLKTNSDSLTKEINKLSKIITKDYAKEEMFKALILSLEGLNIQTTKLSKVFTNLDKSTKSTEQVETNNLLAFTKHKEESSKYKVMEDKSSDGLSKNNHKFSNHLKV